MLMSTRNNFANFGGWTGQYWLGKDFDNLGSLKSWLFENLLVSNRVGFWNTHHCLLCKNNHDKETDVSVVVNFTDAKSRVSWWDSAGNRVTRPQQQCCQWELQSKKIFRNQDFKNQRGEKTHKYKWKFRGQLLLHVNNRMDNGMSMWAIVKWNKNYADM